MHIYFSGIGGTGLGPLALICKQAGYQISGSDMQHSQYTDYLVSKGINLHIGQSLEQIAEVNRTNPIDWIVFSSAVFIHNPRHPELVFAEDNGIKTSKRDECLNMILEKRGLKLLAVSGTHGKTTATAMLIWLFKQLRLPLSYSVGAKLSFGPMGNFDPDSQYFAYECDEFDKNFLSFSPFINIVTAVDWDHHEIYPTREEYKAAFRQSISQSQTTIIYDKDASYLDIRPSESVKIVSVEDKAIDSIKLAGRHNRQDAYLCVQALVNLFDLPKEKVIESVCDFPGANRRFEKLAENIFTDYGHTPEEISATLQLACELSDNVVVAYEPLTDRRQHYMKEQYDGIFDIAKKVYWLPSYLAREDPNTPVLKPEELIKYLGSKTKAEPALKNTDLREKLKKAAQEGDLVICIAGGGGGSLDEWARKELSKN